jgi:hypothetical protein
MRDAAALALGARAALVKVGHLRDRACDARDGDRGARARGREARDPGPRHRLYISVITAELARGEEVFNAVRRRCCNAEPLARVALAAAADCSTIASIPATDIDYSR